MKICIPVAAALFSASVTLAAPPHDDDNAERAANAAPAEQTRAAAAEAEPQEERKICRTERATGSLTRRTRICLTAAQWREVNDRTRRGVDEMSSNASGGKMCVPNPGDPFQGCS